MNASPNELIFATLPSFETWYTSSATSIVDQTTAISPVFGHGRVAKDTSSLVEIRHRHWSEVAGIHRETVKTLIHALNLGEDQVISGCGIGSERYRLRTVIVYELVRLPAIERDCPDGKGWIVAVVITGEGNDPFPFHRANNR